MNIFLLCFVAYKRDGIQGLEVGRHLWQLCSLWTERQGFPLAKELEGIGVLGTGGQRQHSFARAVRVSGRSTDSSRKEKSRRVLVPKPLHKS